MATDDVNLPEPAQGQENEHGEGVVSRVEDELRETAGEAEGAAWQTLYQVRDLAADAVEKVKELGTHDSDNEKG